MNKHKQQMVERFLAHALEIIYLLTGEEYTLVKKSSPHSSIHHLIGEVPIKCDDVAVYFSMDEWEYIEGHKERYKDVMVEDHQTLKTLKSSDHKSPGTQPLEEADTLKQQEVEPKTALDTLELQKENKDTALVNEKEDEEETEELNAEQTADLCVGSQEEAAEQELYLNIKTEVVSDCEEGVDEMDIQQVEICPDLYVGDSESAEQIEEPSVRSPTEAQKQENQENSSTDVLATTNMHEVQQLSLGSPACIMGNFSIPRGYPGAKPIGRKKTSKNRDPAIVAYEQFHAEKSSHAFSDSGNSYISSHVPADHHAVGKAFVCSLCGKGFACNANLAKHKRVHTGERPYACSVCGKCFSQKGDLLRHQQIHTSVKPFACSACGKRFTQKGNLVTHQRSHTGERPFSCSRCGKCFISRSHLARHELIHTR